MKSVIVDISDDGEVRVETKGFRGKSCLEESNFLKELLGKESFRQLTPAYYTTQKQKVKKYLNLCG